MTRLHRILLVFVLALACAAGVRAEMWVWVDEQGTAHWADHQVDARYWLFSKAKAPSQAVFAQPLASPPPSELAGWVRAQPAAAPQARAGAPGQARPSAALSAPPARAALSAPSAAPVSGPRPRLLNWVEGSAAYARFRPLVHDVARQLGLDPNLMVALIAAESAFDPRAVSPKGAIGLMQLMPGTAQRYGVRPVPGASLRDRLMQPEINLRAGAQFLRDLLLMFPGRLDLALAAYNAGPGAVQRAGLRVPDYPETQNYVRVVTELLGHLRTQGSPGLQPIASQPALAVAPVIEPVANAPAATVWLPRQAAEAVERGILLAPAGIPLGLSPGSSAGPSAVPASARPTPISDR
jgi:soluble lytic murein transglycosylase-like protein